mmetsp:Transcript_65286/g.123676  ORF Transcript_65286/g.123676 Transcript_65286/m.123676 type:complete len:242 (+) Transcript_65286:96-821(+)
MTWGFKSCCCVTAASKNGEPEKLQANISKTESCNQSAVNDKPAAASKDAGRSLHLVQAAPPAPVAAPPAVPTIKVSQAQAQATSDVVSEPETASVVSSAKSSARSTMSSVASELINQSIPPRQRETTKIQQAMKKFVRSMVRGEKMGVVSPDGQMRTCTCSLDKRLKNFVIELKGSTRRIPLQSVSDVYQGTEPEDIDTPLDELCSTLTLDSGECITFHFPDVPSRENFAMCLQILADGQQ